MKTTALNGYSWDTDTGTPYYNYSTTEVGTGIPGGSSYQYIRINKDDLCNDDFGICISDAIARLNSVTTFPFNAALYIKRVIINEPATIIIWFDGSKTVVKCGKNEIFDPEKGIAMAILKKVFGNSTKLNKFMNKWTSQYYNNTPAPKEFDYKVEADKLIKDALKRFEKIKEDDK